MTHKQEINAAVVSGSTPCHRVPDTQPLMRRVKSRQIKR